MRALVKFRILSGLIALLIIMSLESSNAMTSQLLWSSEIHKGESYSWKFIKYSDPQSGLNIQAGDIIKIDVLKDVKGLTVSNQSCIYYDCNFPSNTSETLMQYFLMTLNGNSVDANAISELLPVIIHPITYIDDNNQSYKLISPDKGTTQNGDEYIYHYYVNYPDNFQNVTIIWQKSGIMNYYDVETQPFGVGKHVIIIREGYNTDTSNSIGVQSIFILPALFLALLIYRRKDIHQKT